MVLIVGAERRKIRGNTKLTVQFDYKESVVSLLLYGALEMLNQDLFLSTWKIMQNIWSPLLSLNGPGCSVKAQETQSRTI